ncbi:MAG TPA: hypothetical protein VNO21_20605, partial [Polyangiaceae bacterium]|nr:hypothetical protein [Polyangiaceae bacterium]
RDQGVSASSAGGALAVFNVLGIGTALVMPSLAGRFTDQRALALLISLGWGIGIAGLLVSPEAYLVWSIVAGLAQGASISLAFALIVLRARTSEVARGLSGAVQSIGYCIGATGPFALGALRDATPNWTVPLLAMLAVVVAMAAGAWQAGKNVTVG